ncbi:hypothetical protein [Streptomyces sp. ICBB 8177]|uniref:hypothetical protein n=1 Tax=Streptomyces sp. ICBB 8177 TaxID=563922 RepID=UPI000D67707F|nr:hypothetical protein [Streptomyces sp. ICBB 8177]PWI45923.1 hypothetical protein CK485_01885 [Streptomyces sp. ICBB 8177]
MTNNVPGPGQAVRPDAALTPNAEVEEPRQAEEQALAVSGEATQVPSGAKPIIKPDNWVNP